MRMMRDIHTYVRKHNNNTQYMDKYRERERRRERNLESDVFEDDLFNVAADGGLGDHHFAEVQLVQGRGLACVIKANDHDLVLLGREEGEP